VISSQLSDGSLIERHSTVVLMIQAPATITERDFPPIGIESMQVSKSGLLKRPRAKKLLSAVVASRWFDPLTDQELKDLGFESVPFTLAFSPSTANSPQFLYLR
jgi:hypothetical protein